jgi:hypothetical protein
MARKPNFNFERMERDRAKAAKLAEKAKAKSAKKAGETEAGEAPAPTEGNPVPEPDR